VADLETPTFTGMAGFGDGLRSGRPMIGIGACLSARELTGVFPQAIRLSGKPREFFQDIEINRFREVEIEASFGTAAFCGRVRVTRDGDDHALFDGGAASQLARDLVAVHLGHADVEQNQMRPERYSAFDRFRSIASGLGFVSMNAKQKGRGLDSIVIDHEYAQA
jgi:hypothetical protein